MKYNFYKKARKLIALMATATMLAGVCTVTACAEVTSEVESSQADTTITLNNADTKISGDNAKFEDNVLTITDGGSYKISGTLENGQIIIDSEEDVEIILAGVTITNNNGPAIYGKNGDMSIKVLKDTENTLTDGSEYTDLDEDEEPNACIFSHDRITIKGGGKLTVNGNYEDGIASKDEVKINNSNLTVTAIDDGIRGKDYVELNGGEVVVNANGGDGIKSTKGYILVNGGSYTVTSTKKGFESADTFTINDGNIDVVNCTEGIEAVEIIVNGGNIKINASDDGLNASDGSGDGMGMGGFGGKAPQMPQGDDENMTPPQMPQGNDENMTPPQMPQGDDENMPQPPMNNGEMPQNMPKDNNFKGGQNNKAENMTENTSENSSEEETEKKECSIEINGGYIWISAKGDGIDSNGILTFNGGTVFVNGPTSNGDGALDADGTITYNGGTVLAVGSSGMAESPSSSASSGYSISYKTDEIKAGTLVVITNEDDEVLAAFKPEKNISSIVFASEKINENSTIKIYTDGEYSGELSEDNYGESGEYSNGTLLEEIKISGKTTSAGTATVSGFDMRGQGGGRMKGEFKTEKTEDTTAENVL